MEHLVESHLGGYYVSSLDPNIITDYCEQCGDRDYIILSWEEENKMEIFSNYFSKFKITKEQIEKDKNAGITKPEAIENILYSYQGDRYIINNLFKEKVITEKEKDILIKLSIQSRKNQIELICESYPKKIKVLERK